MEARRRDSGRDRRNLRRRERAHPRQYLPDSLGITLNQLRSAPIAEEGTLTRPVPPKGHKRGVDCNQSQASRDEPG